MSFTSSALIVSWLGILVLAAALAGVLQRIHALEQSLVPGGPAIVPVPPEAPLPSHPALDTHGRPLVTIMATAGCGSCHRLLDEMTSLPDALDRRVAWREVADPGTHGIDAHVVDAATFAAVGVTATPFALLIDSAGAPRWRGPVGSIDRLVELIDQYELVQRDRDST